MLKKPENKINWKDSNLALFGSDLEKKIKAASAGKEPAWDGLGEAVTFHIWRIEKFLVKDWPKRKYGKFHKGDSYIILNTYKEDPSKEKLSHDVHIWIGDESSQDEYGTAAYKMVELDGKLGGTAVQHRETQGHESDKFLDYFHKKVTYWEGGIDSGFRHVEPSKAHPQLFHVKGHFKAGTIRMSQEEPRRDRMNSGDVFVLATGEAACWMWVGKESNKDEKTKGMDIAKSYCSKGNVVVLDEGVNDSPEEAKDFWSHIKSEVSLLGPIKRSVTVKKADNKDDTGRSYVPTLFRMGNNMGDKVIKVARAKPTPSGPTKEKLPKFQRKLLKENHSYLLDTGFHVYVWMGKKTRPAVRVLAVLHAETYFNSWKRPILPITIVKQGQETDHFAQFFVDDNGSACMVM